MPEPRPPVFVSGGKRLNFTREDPWCDYLNEHFDGHGKDESCTPSCSWEELCALAHLVVNHPAFVIPGEPGDYYPPRIEDEPADA